MQLHQDHPIDAIILPAPASQPEIVLSLPAFSTPTRSSNSTPMPAELPTAVASRHSGTIAEIPVYAIRRLQEAALAEWLFQLQPDLVCVACFPWRIPASILAIPTHGFVNLHPSLLPAYRGPAPLFWQLRHGLRHSGVTVHWMDSEFDTGAIVAQEALSLPEGASGDEIDALYADIGATLLDKVILALKQGEIPGQSQPITGSYQPWPRVSDFTLDVTWSAQHIYNFMRGTAEWGHPYPVISGDRLYHLQYALRYDPDAKLSAPLIKQNGQVALQCTPGVLHATLLPTSALAPAQRSALDLYL